MQAVIRDDSHCPAWETEEPRAVQGGEHSWAEVGVTVTVTMFTGVPG